MATNNYYFQGPCKWAKVYKPDMKFDPGYYGLDVYLDEDQQKEFKAIGLRNKFKQDEDGTCVGFRRKVGKQPWAPFADWGPPEVVDKDGKPFKELIGNGSVVAVEVVVYDTAKFGKGSRLEKVVVIDHVPYEKEDPSGVEPEEGDDKPKPATAKPKGLPF